MLIEEICEQNSDQDILEALENLPRSFSELMERKMARIQGRPQAQKALKMLQYCGVLKRPLTISESQELLSLEPNQDTFNVEAVPTDMGRVISDCCGLLFVNDDKETVHYIHASVRRYLFTTSHLAREVFKEPSLDWSLGQLCLTYLNLSSFKHQVSKRKQRLDYGFQPLQLGLLSLAQVSSSWKLALAQTILKARRQAPGSSQRDLVEKSLGALGIAQTGPPGLGDQFYFLEYARYHWIDHIKTVDHPTVDNWTDKIVSCIDPTNILAIRPWDDLTEPIIIPQKRNEDGAEMRLMSWALRHERVSLIYHYERFDRSHRDWLMPRIFLKSIQMHKYKVTAFCVARFQFGEMSLALFIATAYDNMEAMRSIIEKQHVTPEHLSARERALDRYWLEGNNFESNFEQDSEAFKAFPCGPVLHTAAFDGRLEFIKLFLSQSINVNCTDLRRGRTALFVAIFRGHAHIVHFLLEHGAHANDEVRPKKSLGLSSLAQAAFDGCEDIVDLLLFRGARISEGRTSRNPLYQAVLGSHGRIVKRLLDAGADPDDRPDGTHPTALQTAAFLGRFDIVETLLRAGADHTLALHDIGGNGKDVIEARFKKQQLQEVKNFLSDLFEDNDNPKEIMRLLGGEYHAEYIKARSLRTSPW